MGVFDSRKNAKRQRRNSARNAVYHTLAIPESLEPRQMLTGGVDDIAGLSDEFNDANTLPAWYEVNQTEGWGAAGAQLNVWDVNTTQPGQMVMQPHSVVWYEDWRGPLVFKEITGDFVVTTRMQITDRDDIGGSDGDNVPSDGQFSLGGLMIRTPRNIVNGADDWVPGSHAEDGTNTGENYIFLSMGHTTGANNFSFEVKTTRNSTSNLEITPLGQNPNEVELRIARIGSSVIALYRLAGETDWTVHRRYTRSDMPETLQVGMVTYSDWEKANDLAPIDHNGSVVAPGQIADPSPWQPFNPDLTAAFDYTRFQRPELPVALQGVDLVNAATNQQLLSFLGDAVVVDPDPEDPDPEDPDPTETDAVMQIGVNLEGNSDFSSAWMFKDAFNRAHPWGVRAYDPISGTVMWQFQAGNGPALQLDEQGWVTELQTWIAEDGTEYQQQVTAAVFTGDANQPAGIYRAEWEGTGVLAMPYVIEQGDNPDGSHYALINMPAGAHFTVDLYSVDPTDYIRNIDIFMPDYNGESLVMDEWHPGDTTSPFHPLFIERLQGLDTLRFMDLQGTNFNDSVAWEDRHQVDDASQADGENEWHFNSGVAPEYLIELANEVDANAWFNMPYQANDDYVYQFATLVRDTLDPELKVYVEWSNEVWNGFFPVNSWLYQQQALPENAGLDVFQVTANEIQRDFDIWTEVFAGQEDRLVRVVAGQQANPWILQQLLVNMDGKFDAVSSSAYAGFPDGAVAGLDAGTTADDIIDMLFAESIPWALDRLAEHSAIADAYSDELGRDIPLVTYESGSHIFGFATPFVSSPALDAALEAFQSPRMYDVYQTLLNGARDAGVDLYNEFIFTSHPSAAWYGTYGLLHGQDESLATAHEYRAIMDFIASQQDVDPLPAASVSDDLYIINEDDPTAMLDVLANDAVPADAIITAVTPTLSGGIVTIAADGRSVDYTPPADFHGIDQFSYTVTLTDGTMLVADVVIDILMVNDPPHIDDLTSVDTNEDTSTGRIGFIVSDPETPAGDLIVTATSSNPSLVPDWSVVLDGEGENRAIRIVPAANQYGSAIITVTVSDGTSTSSDTFEITVNPVNDAPVFTSPAAFSIPENTKAVGTVVATDVDAPAQTISFMITGGPDAAKFSMTAAGDLKFIAAPDFEAPTDVGANNVYNLTITAFDSAGLATTQAVAVTVTNAKEGPKLTLKSGAVEYVGKQRPVVVLPQIDVDGGDKDGGKLLITMGMIYSGKSPVDTLTLPSFKSIGSKLEERCVNGVVSYEIKLNTNVTDTAIESFLKAITFETKGEGLKVATRTMTVKLTDANGLSDSVSQTIHVRKK